MYYTTKRPRWVEGRESFLCVVGTQGRRGKIRNEELEIRNWGGWGAACVNAPIYINPCRGRFHIGPARGGAGSRGRIWNPPLRPTVEHTTTRETCIPRVVATSVGDDARIVPGCLRAAQGLREGHGPPLQTAANVRPNGRAAAIRADVGRDAPSRRTLRRHGVPRADMESAPTTGGKAHDQTGNRGPCMIANPCRGRCLHRPGDLAAARGPAGGMNPAPTNKFYVLGQPERRQPSGRT